MAGGLQIGLVLRQFGIERLCLFSSGLLQRSRKDPIFDAALRAANRL